MTKGKERDEWFKALKRENPNRKKWMPRNTDRICSLYFVDGIPSKANPLMHLGYNTKRQKT